MNDSNINEKSIDETEGFSSQALAIAKTILAGIFLIPTLPILCITFVCVGVALPVLSILNLLSITNIPFNVLFFKVTGLPQIAIALISGILFLFAGLGCYNGLKNFLKMSREVFRK